MRGMFYLIYVDASGDPGKYREKNSRYYVLVGLMLPASQRISLDKDIRQLLLTYFKSEDRLPRELKARNIVSCRKDFAHLRKEQKHKLVVGLLNLLKKYDAVCNAVVIDKVAYWNKYVFASPDAVKQGSMHILLDRVDRALERRESIGAIIYDYEGKKDRAYRDLLEELRTRGSVYWPFPTYRRTISRLVDTIYFITSDLTYGLQLADIVAYIIRAKYENPSKAETTYPLVEEILDKDPRTGRYRDWGLKEIP